MALQREVIASGETQKIHFGINRSDYMLHLGNDAASSSSAAATQGLLQVELNTIASSFGCLSTKVTGLNKHLLPRVPPKFMGTIPDNDAAAGLARGLAFAHREYLKVAYARALSLFLSYLSLRYRDTRLQEHFTYKSATYMRTISIFSMSKNSHDVLYFPSF